MVHIYLLVLHNQSSQASTFFVYEVACEALVKGGARIIYKKVDQIL